MRNLINKLLIIIIFSVVLFACTPGQFLSGAAGTDATEPPVADPPVAAPVAAVEEPDIVFYIQPTIDGGFITTSETTTPPMGKGEFEITLPQKMNVGDCKNIQLIIALNSNKVSKSMPYSQENQDFLQIIQGDIAVWPFIRAELKSSEAINIVSDEYPDKAILSSSPVAIWNWVITPNKSGQQSLILSMLFLPDNAPPVQLAQKVLEILVEEFPAPTQTPVPTQTPAPTPTSIPSVGQQLTGSAIEVMGIIVPAAATIIVTVIGIILNNKFKEKKEREEKDEEKKEQAKREQDSINTKQGVMDPSKAVKVAKDGSKKKKNSPPN